MTPEQIAVELKDHENQIKSLKHRMNEQEERDKTLTDLTTSVKTLAVNMEYMAKEQQRQGERLDCLEKEPAESHKYYKQIIATAVITTLVNAVIGGLLALLIH